ERARGTAWVAVGERIRARCRDGHRASSQLVEHDGAGKGRGVGGFLLRALGRVELAGVDREADREEKGQHQDREQDDGLAFFAVITSKETTECVHRWITNCEPPLRVIWNAPFSRYCDGSGTNGADASTDTRQLRSAHFLAGLTPGMLSG